MAKITHLSIFRTDFLREMEKVSVLWMAVNGGILVAMAMYLWDRFDMTWSQIAWMFIIWNILCFILLLIILFKLLNLPRRCRIVRKKGAFAVEILGLWWHSTGKDVFISESAASEYVADLLDFWNKEYTNHPLGRDKTRKVVYDPVDNKL